MSPPDSNLKETEPVGGWDAEQARGYLEFVLRQDIERYVDLYGWDALADQIDRVRAGNTEDQ